MRKRGRKSADELAVINVNGDPPRLYPPPTLTGHMLPSSSMISLSDGQLRVLMAAADLPLRGGVIV